MKATKKLNCRPAISILVLALAIAMSGNARAQVTIGSTADPQAFSILELDGHGARGLRLPQLTTAERIALEPSLAGNPQAPGLTVFDTSTRCVYTWNGTKWIAQCPLEGEVMVVNPPPFYDETKCSPLPCTTLNEFVVKPLSDDSLVFKIDAVEFKMKPVTGGEFYMGVQISNSSYPNYANRNGVTGLSVHLKGVSSFYMGETEVTQALWYKIMSNNYAWGNTYGVGDNYPAYYLNFYAAIAFCNKLSLKLGKTPCYSVKDAADNEIDWGTLVYSSIPTTATANWSAATCNWWANGFRLPTETEWEYAARGGQKNEYTRTFGVSGTQSLHSGGSLTNPVNDLVQLAAYQDADGNPVNQGEDKGGTGHIGDPGSTTNPPGSTIKVKQLRPNELGIYDMNGNVSEWCWDWAGYDYSTCCDAIDYHGETNPLSNYRITRGGSFSSKDQGAYLHVFNRSNSSISSRSMFHTGLRIVMRAE